MSTRAVEDQPDTEEMVVIHRIFRHGFATVADLARGVPEGDTGRAAALARHVEFLLDALHHHHSTEDDHLWPRLLERAEPDAVLIGRMEEQHQVVAGHIEHLRRALATWRTAPAGPVLADTLDELNRALTAHFDEEEKEVLPLVRAHITSAEWQELGEAAFEKFTDDEKLIALGQMLDVATPAEAAKLFGTLPLPVRLMWRIVGRRRYGRYMRAVTGTGR